MHVSKYRTGQIRYKKNITTNLFINHPNTVLNWITLGIMVIAQFSHIMTFSEWKGSFHKAKVNKNIVCCSNMLVRDIKPRILFFPIFSMNSAQVDHLKKTFNRYKTGFFSGLDQWFFFSTAWTEKNSWKTRFVVWCFDVTKKILIRNVDKDQGIQ